jgi:hypothetical protein
MDLSGIALDPSMVLLVGVLVALGYFLKSTPDIPDWLIGWILLVLSIVGAIFKIGATVDGVANGIMAAALAVYGNNLFKQTTVNRLNDRTGVVPTVTVDPPKETVPTDAKESITPMPTGGIVDKDKTVIM